MAKKSTDRTTNAEDNEIQNDLDHSPIGGPSTSNYFWIITYPPLNHVQFDFELSIKEYKFEQFVPPFLNKYLGNQ